jgi:hypothetical protein
MGKSGETIPLSQKEAVCITDLPVSKFKVPNKLFVFQEGKVIKIYEFEAMSKIGNVLQF